MASSLWHEDTVKQINRISSKFRGWLSNPLPLGLDEQFQSLIRKPCLMEEFMLQKFSSQFMLLEVQKSRTDVSDEITEENTLVCFQVAFIALPSQTSLTSRTTEPSPQHIRPLTAQFWRSGWR